MNISKLRKDLNLNQTQFGNLFGVHSMTVSKWERGILIPSDYQIALMQEFKVSAKESEVAKTLGAILLGAGVVAALYLLLSNAKK